MILLNKGNDMAKKEQPTTSSKKAKEAAPPPPPAAPAPSDLFPPDELEKFKVALTKEKEKILVKAREALNSGNIHLDKNEMYDEVDLASATIDQNLTFRLLDRDRKLLAEIEHALSKIDTGEFGYCEGTGEPIPKRRLELRPWTRHSVKYKEYLERMKKAGRLVSEEEVEEVEE